MRVELITLEVETSVTIIINQNMSHVSIINICKRHIEIFVGETDQTDSQKLALYHLQITGNVHDVVR